jgi:DNA repair protein RAD16
MAQWEQELHDKIDPAFRPSICLYHGPNRPTSPHQVVKYDVVITTYSILTSSYPKIYKDKRDPNVTRRRPKGPLFKIRFFRVVLDEAQAIKNRCSEGFAAAFEIKADRRWVLSGTPIQNSVDDMYS